MANRFEAPVTKRNVSYPSPFFDVGQRYIPTNIKEIFKWTKYHYVSNSVVYPIISKISEYPVTGFTYDGVQEAALSSWENIIETTLQMRSFLISVHQDVHVYGNAFVLIHYPFIRYLTSPSGKRYRACDIKYKIKFQDKKWHFHGMDPKTNTEVVFEHKDIYVSNKTMIKLSKIDPKHIDIDHNSFTGISYYNYTVPTEDTKKIRANVRVYLDNTPSIIFDAIAQGKNIRLDDNSFYHFSRPTIAGLWPGWGTPSLVPVLKDIHYYAIMRKANEALALQHINPLMMLFPQANADVSPYKSLNLSDWKRKVEDELARWRKDPNYIPIMPMPIGHQYIGGMAKQYMVTQEAEFVARGIAAALGVPLEFLTGGLSWSGSSVSLRILENAFIKQREEDTEFLNNFLVPRICKYFKLPKAKINLKTFKMADDIQFQQIMVNLMQGGFVSRKRVLDQWNIKQPVEHAQMKIEHAELAAIQRDDQVSNAEVQGMIQAIMARSNAISQFESQKITRDLQNEMNAPVENNPEMRTKVSLKDVAQKYAAQIMVMPPESAQEILNKMEQEMPNLFSLVMTEMQNMQAQAQQPQKQVEQQQPQQPPVGGQIEPQKSKQTTDMRPMPEQKPPRRAGGV